MTLSREQVYRLVAGQPERLNVYTLAALCDLLECEVGDLLEPVVERQPAEEAGGQLWRGRRPAPDSRRSAAGPARIVDAEKPPTP